MDFDQMLASWRTQDSVPLYSVRRDALLHALRAEDTRSRKARRRDMWIVYVGGTGTAVAGGLWLATSIRDSWPLVHAIAAGAGFLMVALSVGVYGVTRWRQAMSERSFGNTLRDEVERTLSRVDFEIARFGSWSTASLQIAPPMVGAMLIAWSVTQSHDGSHGLGWMCLISALLLIYLVRMSTRNTKQKLEPRQQRLRDLLSALDTQE